jgi:Ran GTPase-activating protein (RanGAP) involved in mRNA processing and transport
MNDIFGGRGNAEIPPALSYLLTALVNLPELRTIVLSGNAIGEYVYDKKKEHGTIDLIEFLSTHVPLQHLYLANIGLSGETSDLIARALWRLHKNKVEAKTSVKLETVVCGKQHLRKDSMAAWAQTFRLHDQVKVVDIQGSRILTGGLGTLMDTQHKKKKEDHKAADSVAKDTDEKKEKKRQDDITLLHTVLLDTKFRDADLLDVVPPNLKKYESENEIMNLLLRVKPKGGLKHAKKLEVLNLYDNTFTDACVSAFTKQVPRWPELVELDLSDTVLRDRGAYLLGLALEKGKNGKLRTLRLQGNEIKSRGIAKLSGAVVGNAAALQRIELDRNQFDEENESVQALKELLDERKSRCEDDEVDEEAWGLDEFEEPESESEPESDEEEPELEPDSEEEGIIDELASKLEKTSI